MKFIVLMSVIFSIKAFAADVSYSFYQPKGGVNSIELSYGTYSAKGSTAWPPNSLSIVATPFSFSYTYGITDNQAIGIENYTSDISTSANGVNVKNSGLGDWNIWYKGIANYIYYGFSAVPSSTKNIAATSTVVGNNTQGGPSFSPYFGMMGTQYGFRITYNYMMSRLQDASPNPDSTITGGNERIFEFYNESTGSSSKRVLYLNISSIDASVSTNYLGAVTTGTSMGSLLIGYKGIYNFSKVAGLTWDLQFGNFFFPSGLAPAVSALTLGLRFDI